MPYKPVSKATDGPATPPDVLAALYRRELQNAARDGDQHKRTRTLVRLQMLGVTFDDTPREDSYGAED